MDAGLECGGTPPVEAAARLLKWTCTLSDSSSSELLYRNSLVANGELIINLAIVMQERPWELVTVTEPNKSIEGWPKRIRTSL